ncbi:MAG TPA: protein kinase [Terriglobales bacterium]|nr:protein kinase [Terriglobales bacterium]
MAGAVGLTAGTRLGAYEIQSPLGAGGMGEVYRATDTKLGRDVALKVLPAEMAQDAERLGRFRREAKVLAQLDHPNIVTIYSVEESAGVHFLTMQLVDGQPLDRLIPQDGLPIERIVEIGSALADALAAAHEKGIVHRDLKPANVMVSNEGRVKVLDFGLAKDVRGSNLGDATLTSASQTQVGVVMGTPAYMSPEQTSGRTLDHRTDIFSMGVVLHEMATGRRPFEGTSSAELVSAILRDNPPPVTDVRPELPSDLARIIRRCLEKDPRHRLQTARDLSNEFRDLARLGLRPAPVSASAARATVAADSGASRTDEGFWVAVLPFKYSGASADLTALAEALSDEVVTGLSRFPYLRVIARSSTARYAGQVDVRVAGKELSARYVMEGTLRQAGSRLRFAVQLVDTVSGAHLWAENYERAFSPENIFELQDDLVPRIVSTVADMNGVLPRSLSEAVRQRAPEQLTPYEAVLRSFGYFERVTAEELKTAMAGLESAVQKAPTYADAWAMLALLSVQRYAQGFGPAADSLTTGAAAARKAVETAPASHLAWFSLSQVLFFQKEFQAFRNAAERALALNPMDSNSLAFHGEMLAYSGEWERGLSLAERARQLNPHHPAWYWHVDFNHAYRQRDYRAALEIASKMNQTGNWGAHLLTAAACGQLGDRDGAAKALRELLRIRPGVAARVHADAEKWFDPEYRAHLMEGLRKAGLEIPDVGAPADQKMSASPLASSGMTRDSGASRAEEGFWVAVLPFKYTGSDQDLKALAEGLSEEVITGLSRFSYLRVIARGSTAKYSKESGAVRAIGGELGARYVMEGSLRQAGSTIRLAAQLVDASSGAHLWAETFERAFRPDDIFALQDQLVPRIVSTVADQHGILPRSISAAIRKKSDDQVTPFEAVFRVFSLHEKMTEHEHAACRDLLERVVRDAPDAADCWAMLSSLYADEDWFGFNLQADPLGRAAAAAQRAAELAPGSVLASQALAQSLFTRHEWQAFRSVAERTIALNPMEGATVALMGILLACSGDWERGCAVADSAMNLHPNFPGWYWLAKVFNAYRTRDYRAAIDAALRIQMPGYFWTSIVLAAAHGQLDEIEAAQKALRGLLAVRPNFAGAARQELEKWLEPELAGHFLEGLSKAGLEDAAGTATSAGSSGLARTQPNSGATRAEEGFWVAMLPFKYTGSNQDLKAFAEGLSEEVITGLSRFSYLRVIARGSTAKYSSESEDVRAIGKELGARYVMEGSLRQAGKKLRLTVQLADTVSGAHLWAETYERGFTPESVFEIQDDLVPRIVSTVADQYGVLPRSMSEVLRNKSEESLTPHEAVLRAFSYFTRLTFEEHATIRRILESAVRQAPDQADCWAMLSLMYIVEYSDGFNALPNPLDRALAAAQRAVDLGPTHALGHYALAFVYFFRKEKAPFRAAVERTLALNPMDGTLIGLLGLLMHHAGEEERGLQMVESAMQLNPNYPGLLRFTAFTDAYCHGKYAEALEAAVRINMPGFFYSHASRAAALGQLGQHEAAQKAVQDLVALRPDFAAAARQEYAKWYASEQVEHLIDGLRKAGLDIPENPSANMSDDKKQKS